MQPPTIEMTSRDTPRLSISFSSFPTLLVYRCSDGAASRPVRLNLREKFLVPTQQEDRQTPNSTALTKFFTRDFRHPARSR